MALVLAIVGRPNVGKSRLFNRWAGRAAAIVHDTPGVTRDRQALDVEYQGLAFQLIDTAGFEDAASGSIAHRMTKQTLAAIADAQALLFVVDARDGLTAGDQIIAQALRKSGKPVILAANKCEGRTLPPAEAWGLGLGEPIAISAEHNIGMAELADALAPLAPKALLAEEEDDEDEAEEGESEDEIEGEAPVVHYLDRPLR